ncbi:hypothetical protein TraAM80_05298 [Trypanosoma rangeli]|uniref:Mucin-associated surface protein (MASP) n=1 Tax=Trypanosoma rangeli TaxID=5698 RepID=A0A3R7KYY2_TRYRA|nr:uncharacterized protein TraAM80_05298 [Trypanosoma rangeli]RNF04147.1 hypothetical protein TraAM80_05298 [Trypanosoma rangeli]|eukprot:RNF04147.1 hypothetical protein TraAM80_05298 [Trypanosoma rangeli]
MAMATVRRRAVCALAVLALLWGCSSVCGATALGTKSEGGHGASGQAVPQAAFQHLGGTFSHELNLPSGVYGSGAAIGQQGQGPASRGALLHSSSPQSGASTAPCCAKDHDRSKDANRSCLTCAPGIAGRPPRDDETRDAAEYVGPRGGSSGANGGESSLSTDPSGPSNSMSSNVETVTKQPPPCVPGVPGQPPTAGAGTAQNAGCNAGTSLGVESGGSASHPARTTTTDGVSGKQDSKPAAGAAAAGTAPCDANVSNELVAACVSGMQFFPAAPTHSQPQVIVPSINGGHFAEAPQKPHSYPGAVFQAPPDPNDPAFLQLHGDGVGVGGNFPGSALVGRHFVPPRSITGRPSGEGVANQQNTGRTAEGGVDAKVGEAGDVTHNSGPAAATGPGSNSANRHNEGGQPSAAAVAGTALSVQTNGQSSAEDGATRGELAASSSQEPSGESPSSLGTPAGAAQEESRMGAADAGGAHSGGASNGRGAGTQGGAHAGAATARNATSALAARNNSGGDLLLTRTAEDGTVCGRRVLPTLLLLGLWVFAAM